jgi:hypothetical protein
VAKHHGKAGHFTIDGVDLTEYLTDISLEESVDTAEVSTMGSDDKEFVEGMAGSTISLSGVWDETAVTGPDVTLSGLKGAGANPFVYGPAGGDPGDVTYTGSAILTSYARTTPVGGAVAFTAGFQVTGAVARAVVAP